MKTEPNVPYYTNLAKERICFSLVKVSGSSNNLCVINRLNAARVDPFTGWPTCTWKRQLGAHLGTFCRCR